MHRIEEQQSCHISSMGNGLTDLRGHGLARATENINGETKAF